MLASGRFAVSSRFAFRCCRCLSVAIVLAFRYALLDRSASQSLALVAVHLILVQITFTFRLDSLDWFAGSLAEFAELLAGRARAALEGAEERTILWSTGTGRRPGGPRTKFETIRKRN